MPYTLGLHSLSIWLTPRLFSFEDIEIRLKEIGRADVAEKLSRAVYHEKADEARQAFLDDPFKDLIHEGSQMLEEAPQRAPTGRPPPQPQQWSVAQVFWIIVLFLMVSGLLIGLVILNCPDVCNYKLCELIGRRTMGIPDDVTFDRTGKASIQVLNVWKQRFCR